MVDALDSGSSGRKVVEVRVLSRAPALQDKENYRDIIMFLDVVISLCYYALLHQLQARLSGEV